MSLLGSCPEYDATFVKLTLMEQTAWKLYCEETAGDMDVKDFWHELPHSVQQIYLRKVKEELKDED